MPHASLASRRNVGGSLELVTFDVDHETAGGYVMPGQYVEVKTPGAKGYFVLASDPGAPQWQLLIRNAGGAAAEILGAPIGSAFELSKALGKGFPLAAAGRRELVVGVVASALGAARPSLRYRVSGSIAARTRVLLGVRRPADVPLMDEVDGWRSGGVQVILCVSSDMDDADVLPGVVRERGYVQTVLERTLTSARIAHDALVVAAGPKAMLEEVRGLTKRFPSLEVVTNA